MTYFITTCTLVGLTVIGYGLWLAWPPLALVTSGLVFLKVAWSLDDDDGGDE